ncbi:hypothetical protein PO909_029365 [Leuciscus waleckii]
MNQLTARGEPFLRARGCCVMCCASLSEAIRAGGVMEGLVRAGGVMEGLVRAGGVMEGLVRAGGVMEGLVRAAGRVMEGLIHGTISRIQLCALHPTKMHKHNTKAVILTAQCHLISVLFRRQKRFFSQMPLSSSLAGPAPPQKLCSKCTDIKNQKSAVIALFEITIIKINYNLIFK